MLIFASYGNETGTFAIVKSVIAYSVFGILYHMHNTYKKNNGRRGPAISVSDIGNDILYYMEKMIFKVMFLHTLALVTMLILSTQQSKHLKSIFN